MHWFARIGNPILANFFCSSCPTCSGILIRRKSYFPEIVEKTPPQKNSFFCFLPLRCACGPLPLMRPWAATGFRKTIPPAPLVRQSSFSLTLRRGACRRHRVLRPLQQRNDYYDPAARSLRYGFGAAAVLGAATEVAGAEEVGWNGSAEKRALLVGLFPWQAITYVAAVMRTGSRPAASLCLPCCFVMPAPLLRHACPVRASAASGAG